MSSANEMPCYGRAMTPASRTLYMMPSRLQLFPRVDPGAPAHRWGESRQMPTSRTVPQEISFCTKVLPTNYVPFVYRNARPSRSARRAEDRDAEGKSARGVARVGLIGRCRFRWEHDFGVADLRAQPAPACASRSIRPTRETQAIGTLGDAGCRSGVWLARRQFRVNPQGVGKHPARYPASGRLCDG